MSKLSDMQKNLDVVNGQLAALQMLLEVIITEGIRTKSFDEKGVVQVLDQGITVFQNNKSMTDRETFGAIGTLASAADMLKRAKEAKIITWTQLTIERHI